MLLLEHGGQEQQPVDQGFGRRDARVLPILPECFVTDRPGLCPAAVAGGVTDSLRSRGYRVVAFNGGGAASQRFLNLRAACHWRFRELLERGEVDLPRDSQLMEEALALEWQLAPSGGIQILSKDSLRKSLGRSPDNLDSVVMAVWLSMRPERRTMPSYSYFSWS